MRPLPFAIRHLPFAFFCSIIEQKFLLRTHCRAFRLRCQDAVRHRVMACGTAGHRMVARANPPPRRRNPMLKKPPQKLHLPLRPRE
jgi:hypothetical protein